MTEGSTILPPLMGVRLAWALTGTFKTEQRGSDGQDEPMKNIETPVIPSACEIASPVQTILRDLYYIKDIPEKEKKYIQRATISIYAHMRNLATVYCARELYFKENELLRQEYLNFIKQNINFGSELKDWLKALPTVAIGGVTGVALAQSLAVSGIMFWALGILLAVFGFIVYEWWMVYSCRRKQWTYVSLYYERTLYYKQYLTRVRLILADLYYDLNELHREIFGAPYPTADPVAGQKQEIDRFTDYLLEGIRPTLCPDIDCCITIKGWLNSMVSGIKGATCDNPLTPELWPLCLTGDKDARKYCMIGCDPKYSWIRERKRS